ncbi:MAG: hypothetical protein C0391_03635 [Anaerolinea sp.]|nr:hypothetical protein [Anaerolinea sp.]
MDHNEILFSNYFNLNKTQSELDFVDIPINGDIHLFIDPFAISQRTDPWSINCHSILVSYFQHVIDRIRRGDRSGAINSLSNLSEPNETRLGFSKGRPKGSGVGSYQAEQLFATLLSSTAVRTGLVTSIEECELMIPGINRDKISDLTTNIIRKLLVEYTNEQCDLFNIPTQNVALHPYFSIDRLSWVNGYHSLPLVEGDPILLVPKIIVRYDPSYDHQKYFHNFILDYLQAENLSAGSSLVHTLKNGRSVVYKKDIAANFPCTKENIYLFSKDHPDVLARYRQELQRMENSGKYDDILEEDESNIGRILIEALRSIPPGNLTASDYHNLMLGIVEFIFFPNLLHPVKEREIHEGRKRIDIHMENGARSGIFFTFHQIRDIPCSYVPFECKNYQSDIANPELDQLSGRFSINRGKVGFICCRSFGNRKLFISRCRDTFNDGRGLIIPLDDDVIINLLENIINGQRQNNEDILNETINTICI